MSKTGQGRVLGVGGIFFRSADPARLGAWYEQHLGMRMEAYGESRGASFPPASMPASGFTVWGAFPADTDYFGAPSQGFMINLVVDDLDAALGKVEEGGAEVLEAREEEDFGRFGWFVDPDGNRVELWEPPAGEGSQ